jgi:leader peptidase (prepilin peptidase)/N-methyltransferase
MIGGYTALLVYRLPRGENIFTPSHCPHCNRKLKLWELFPLLGRILVDGKCRTCHTEIDIQYTRIESRSVGFMFFSILFVLLGFLITNIPISNRHILLVTLFILLYFQFTQLMMIVGEVVFHQQLLTMLLSLFIGVFFYFIIFITVPILIGNMMRIAGINISQHIVLFIILTSAIDSIIWIFYFGLLLRLLCRNQCGNGNVT